MDDPARPLLTQVRAKHFKSLGDLSLDLGPLTVLVGPNGSGKSNVVAVLRFLRDAATRGLRHAFGEQGGSPTIPQRGHSKFEVGVSFAETHGRADYDASVQVGLGSEAPSILEERLELQTRFGLRALADIQGGVLTPGSDFGHEIDGAGDFNLLEAHALIAMPSANPTARRDIGDAGVLTEYLPGYIKRIGIYNPIPSGLRKMIQRETYAAPFEEDGRNLGATLAAIRDTPDAITTDRALELLVDGAVGYHVEQATGLLVPFIDYAGQGDGEAAASDLGLESDGTIRMMAMLAALYQTPPRSLVVLEEPEAGLHPGALSVLADVIKEASTRCQVVITTHSPDLIDCFDLDSLRVVEKVNGETRVGPVRPAQQEAVRRKLFSPGELMRMEGLQLDLG